MNDKFRIFLIFKNSLTELTSSLFLLVLLNLFSSINLNAENNNTKYLKLRRETYSQKKISDYFEISSLNWEKINSEDVQSIIWKKINGEEVFTDIDKNYSKNNTLNSFNRSIVFDNKRVGPDISWLVPPGLQWTKKHSFDASIRGHNRRDKDQPLLGWNGGDAVGQLYYHPLFFKNFSMGVNVGMRSIYSGQNLGGGTNFGEGLSMGFRIDKKLSDTSGLALGGEQVLHFDGLTDTGRDLYITTTKGWWKKNESGNFPLNIATFGFGTGKLAEGNIKGLCSNLLGGSGTEVANQRSLCWSPIFSISRVFNPKISTFFEYNSKWFLVGSSFAPFKSIPLRGTFALQISDHIDNYKINSFEELKWNFRLSYGF